MANPTGYSTQFNLDADRASLAIRRCRRLGRLARHLPLPLADLPQARQQDGLALDVFVLGDAALLIAGELKDPRIGFVTVTRVEVTPDLRTARIYVGVLGTEKQRTTSLAGLKQGAGFLRRALGRTLREAEAGDPLCRFERQRSDILAVVDRKIGLTVRLVGGERTAPYGSEHALCDKFEPRTIA